MSTRSWMRCSMRRLALPIALLLALTACGGDEEPAAPDDGAGTPEPAEEPEEPAEDTEEAPAEGDGGEAAGETISVSVSPSGLPVYVASQEGLFEGDIEIDVSLVGYDQSASLFLAGDTPLGWIAPLEVAEFASQGEDFRYFSTAGATNMINGLVIRSEDADTYQDIEDLVGETVGNPGFGTGTWATFEVILGSEYGIDAQSDFDNVTADSGALLGLLEEGEIEAALLFSGQSAAALSLDQFETIFSFTEAWQEATGQPMVVNGPVARTSWLEENEEAAQVIVDGIDAAVQWIKDNPEEFQEGGEYEEWVDAEGWLTSPETTDSIMQLLQDDQWYLTSDTYTQEWVDAFYELIVAGEGILVEEVPEKDAVFYPPSS